MQVIVKYTGYGLLSRGINFDATKNDGLYTVSKEDADYLIKTFPKQFVLIEKKVKGDGATTPYSGKDVELEKPAEEKPETPKRKTRRKKTQG